MEKIYKVVESLYKQQFGVEPPKYLKYISIAFAGFGLLIARNIFWKLLNKLRSYPPGPLGLPFIGCLFSFGGTPRKFLVNTANTYGPIAYFPLLASNNIIISDPKIMVKLYQNEKIIDRPEMYSRPTPSFMESSGSIWSKRRKYASTTVFSITKSSFILSSVKKCINKYLEPIMDEKYVKNKELWYPAQDLYCMSMNNILSATFDIILPFDDQFITDYANITKEVFSKIPLMFLCDLMFNYNDNISSMFKYPLTGYWHKDGDKMLVNFMRNNGFIIDREKNILRRKDDKERDNANSKLNVYIDFLISKYNENEIKVKEITSDLHLILAAAIDTTTKSMEYGFLLLAKYPDIQEMIYKELQDIMNENNLKEFDFSIINKLHIFRAFIHEVLRISSVTATGLPHITNRKHNIDIDGKNMVIPKGTVCHANVYFMQRYLDWNDGNKILKERNDEIHLEYWLKDDDDGNGNKKFKMNDNFVLFGVGKRNCVGQSLAMKAIYATFGLMINKYKFKPENNDTNGMDIKQEWSIVLEIDPPIGIQVDKR